MAGDRQTPSGTSFDPAPQFSVYQVVGHQPLSITGRCYFAPVKTGTVFDLHLAPGHDPQKPDQCHLLVQEIFFAERPVDELGQVSSARLILSGDVPPLLTPESLLIALNSADTDQWQLAGSLWLRTQQ